VKHDFAFSGLIACGHCGCSIVGEIKKQRYVYYHCTGYKGRCEEPYVREEIIEQQFTRLLGRLKFDDEVLDWVREALDASHADERREHDELAGAGRASPFPTGFPPPAGVLMEATLVVPAESASMPRTARFILHSRHVV
jgi:hypothetical protein